MEILIFLSIEIWPIIFDVDYLMKGNKTFSSRKASQKNGIIKGNRKDNSESSDQKEINPKKVQKNVVSNGTHSKAIKNRGQVRPKVSQGRQNSHASNQNMNSKKRVIQQKTNKSTNPQKQRRIINQQKGKNINIIKKSHSNKKLSSSKASVSATTGVNIPKDSIKITDYQFSPNANFQYLVNRNQKESYENAETVDDFQAIKKFWIHKGGVDKNKRQPIKKREGTLDFDNDGEEEEEEEEIIEYVEYIEYTEEEEEEEESDGTNDDEEEEYIEYVEYIEYTEEEEEEEEEEEASETSNNYTETPSEETGEESNFNPINNFDNDNNNKSNPMEKLHIFKNGKTDFKIIGITQMHPVIILAIQTKDNQIIKMTSYEAKKLFPFQLSKFYEQYITFV